MEAIYLNEFLDKARESKKPISVYTINGFPMSGVLTGYDSQCIKIESNGEEMLIMYSAISTLKMAGANERPYKPHSFSTRPPVRTNKPQAKVVDSAKVAEASEEPTQDDTAEQS